MTATVVRHYVHETGGLPTFPVYALGPKPDGPGNLFEFKPDTPVPADPVDNYWPTDDFFGEHFAGFLDTTGLPPNLSDAVGDYDIQVEAFTPAGVSVAPGPGTFQFIVPDAVQGDGTVTARAAALAEIVGNAFQFRLHIDNTPCTAAIDPPHIGVLATTDDCGFLRYDEGASDPVTLSFTPHHDHAVFGFGVQRGVTPVTAASTLSKSEMALRTCRPPGTHLVSVGDASMGGGGEQDGVRSSLVRNHVHPGKPERGGGPGRGQRKSGRRDRRGTPPAPGGRRSDEPPVLRVSLLRSHSLPLLPVAG
jgi:hypothetical protein